MRQTHLTQKDGAAGLFFFFFCVFVHFFSAWPHAACLVYIYTIHLALDESRLQFLPIYTDGGRRLRPAWLKDTQSISLTFKEMLLIYITAVKKINVSPFNITTLVQRQLA